MTRLTAILVGLTVATLLGCLVWHAWIRQPPAREFELFVMDARGQPVERYACAQNYQIDDQRSVLDLVRPRLYFSATATPESHRAGGETKILEDSERFTIEIRAPGYRRARLGPLVTKSLPSRIEITVADLEFVSGRVTHAGRDIAGATIEARESSPHPLGDSMFGGRAEVWRAVTDGSGSFRLGVDPALQPFDLYACAAGFGRSRQSGVEVGGPPVLFELSSGGSIDGILHLPPDRPIGGAAVEIYREESGVDWDPGPCISPVGRVDDQGRFSFEHVGAGAWLVRLCAQEHGNHAYPMPADELPFVVHVPEQGRTSVDLDLTQAATRIDAHWTLDGRAWRRVSVTLLTLDEPSLAIDRAYADKTGAWTLRARQPGQYRLLATGSGRDDGGPQTISAVVSLREVPVTWQHDFTWEPGDPDPLVLEGEDLPEPR